MSDTMFDAMFGAALAAGSGEAGFTPTETQLAAMNSGIDSEKVQQIETNKTNILSKQDTLVVGTNLDDEPIEDSTNPITSGGVFNTVGNIDAALDSLIMSLEPKTITANGTYDPTDDGVDGYSEVTVNVPSGNANYIYNSSAGVNFAPKFALESITIPDGYYTVASEAFLNYIALKTVNFSSSVYAISSKAFQGCTSLTSIEIPSSITQIAYNAFSDCTNLVTITINKPEGGISDAPWGATNATVVWTG